MRKLRILWIQFLLYQILELILYSLFQLTPKIVYLSSISVLGIAAIITTMMDRYVELFNN